MFREYYKLYFKTFLNLWVSGIDWKAYSAEILSAFVGGWLFVRANNWGIVKNNLWDFFVSIVAFPVALAFAYSIYKLAFTPVEIFGNQKIRLANRSWYDIEFEPIYFTERGMNVAAIRVRNNKPIEITELNLQVFEIWDEGRLIAQERSMYWSGNETLHNMGIKDVLSPNGGEGIVPIAIATSQEAYLDEQIARTVVNDEEVKPRLIYFEVGKQYFITIKLIARMDTVKIPTPYPFIKGALIYEPPKVKFTIESINPHRPNHEISESTNENKTKTNKKKKD